MNKLVFKNEREERILNIEFQFHDICNIKCSYCKLNSGKHKITMEYIKNIAQFIKDKNLKEKFDSIEIMVMGGETFLDLDVYDQLLELFEKLNNEIRITNILLLSNFILDSELIEKQLQKITDAGFNYDLEVTLHAQEYNFEQLIKWTKNFLYFKKSIISVNVLEGDLRFSNEPDRISAYKKALRHIKFSQKDIAIQNVYICDVVAIKEKGKVFCADDNILKQMLNVTMDNLSNTFTKDNKEYRLSYLNENYIGHKENYNTFCNVKNNLVFDASGHVRWCGNFDQFEEDVIPDIKITPDNFDVIYDYFFTDSCIKCPYTLCMGGVFDEITVEKK